MKQWMLVYKVEWLIEKTALLKSNKLSANEKIDLMKWMADLDKRYHYYYSKNEQCHYLHKDLYCFRDFLNIVYKMEVKTVEIKPSKKKGK